MLLYFKIWSVLQNQNLSYTEGFSFHQKAHMKQALSEGKPGLSFRQKSVVSCKMMQTQVEQSCN